MSQTDTTDNAGPVSRHEFETLTREFRAYQEAMRKKTERLEERIADLETITCGKPEQELATLSRDQKVNRLRRYLADKATDNAGTYAARWKEVRGFFDGAFSDGHYYDIMDAAGDANGFNYGESLDGSKRISVDLDVL